MPAQCQSWRWPLLWCRSNHFGHDWLASQTRYARGSFSRRAIHASSDSPCHSSAKPPPLEGLSPSHGAFQEHAAHTIEWSIMLSSKGSSGTCIPEGVSTFFHAAFTAHRDAGADAGGSQVQRQRSAHPLISQPITRALPPAGRHGLLSHSGLSLPKSPTPHRLIAPLWGRRLRHWPKSLVPWH